MIVLGRIIYDISCREAEEDEDEEMYDMPPELQRGPHPGGVMAPPPPPESPPPPEDDDDDDEDGIYDMSPSELSSC